MDFGVIRFKLRTPIILTQRSLKRLRQGSSINYALPKCIRAFQGDHCFRRLTGPVEKGVHFPLESRKMATAYQQNRQDPSRHESG